MGKDKEQGGLYTKKEWAERFSSTPQNNNFLAFNQLVGTYVYSSNPNLYHNVPGAPLPKSNYYQAPIAGDNFPRSLESSARDWNGQGANHQASQTPPQSPTESHFIFDQYPDPGTAKDSNVRAAQTPPYQDQYQNQQWESGYSSQPLDNNPPFNQFDPNAQFVYQNGSPGSNSLSNNVGDKVSGDFEHNNTSEQTQPIQPLTNEQVMNSLQLEMDLNKKRMLEAVLGFIENTKVGIQEQIETNKEANISKNAQKLFNQTEELFLYYSTAAELEQTAAKKTEWKEKAKEQFEEIQANPLYSKEINNEQERRDICERTLRFIGNTTSRVIGLGLGFGAAVAVASLMIPPAVVLYGPIIVAGPVIAAGAGGAAAFMANKLGYKIADLTISNTAAFAGKILDGGKNKVADLWKSWKGDKQQEKALTKLKNSLLQEIETAQEGFMLAKKNGNQAEMDEHLENLYIKASVLKDLETSIVGKRAAEKKEQEALEHWKNNASFIEKTAKKIGAEETWKFIRETRPKNICEKLGVITGKILGLAIAAGVGAAAAVAITTSIGAAATILYGPMAVVGITAAAGIAAGAVSYKIANPVATWSAKKVGQVADLAKNAICEVGKNIAVGVINLATGKGKHSNKVSAQKQEKQKEGHKK